MSSPDFDNQTLAVLRGRMVRYLMRSREVRPARPSLSSSPSPSPHSLARFPSSVDLPLTALPMSGPDFSSFPGLCGPLPFLRSQPSPAPFSQITLGRATKDNQIDVDLSLEGPAWKISRKQGICKKQREEVPSAPGFGLHGNLRDRQGLRSWHFKIPNLGVLGAL